MPQIGPIELWGEQKSGCNNNRQNRDSVGVESVQTVTLLLTKLLSAGFRGVGMLVRV
tara:strand:- start:384 stop:554 length:171 start_codon:yes stop_codon:yes gene_type:complete